MIPSFTRARPKTPSEVWECGVDFSTWPPAAGATINSNTVSVSVISGTDANPDAILQGSPIVNLFEVSQFIEGGLNGVTYLLKYLVVFSNGEVAEQQAVMYVSTLQG